MTISQEHLDHWFQYHRPSEGDPEAYERIRNAGKAFAEVVLAETPASADQTAAVRKIREAVFTANAARACRGR
jgi:hypothetical protein